MSKNEIGQDSPIPKFIYLKIRRRDGVESLTILAEGEFKVPIDGCIRTEYIAQIQILELYKKNRLIVKDTLQECFQELHSAKSV